MFDMIRNKRLLVLQHDETDCAPACIASLCKFYGKRIPISEIRELCFTNTLGTYGNAIVKVSEELGFSCKGSISRNKEITHQITYPFVAHINKNNNEHFVIVYKYKNKKVYVGDPATGFKIQKIEDFKKEWTGIFFVIFPMEQFRKNKNRDTKITRFLYVLLPYRKSLLEIFLASLLLSFIGIITAFYFRFLIDEILYNGTEITLTIFSIGYALVIIFQVLLSLSRNYLMIYMSSKIDATLIFDYFHHMLKLPIDFFTNRKTGEILSRVNDTATIRSALSSTSLSIILDSIMFLFGGIFMFIFGGTLVIVAVIPVILSSVVVYAFFAPYKNMIHEKAIIDAEKNSAMVETINGVSTLKSLCAEKFAFERIEMRVIDSVKKGIGISSFGNIQGTLHLFLQQIGTLAIYWIGSLNILAGSMSLGKLISFSILSGYFLGPLSRLLNLQPMLQESIVAAKRLAEVLDEEEEDLNSGSIVKDNISGNIELCDVRFSYGMQSDILSGVSLSIENGKKVAFVGLSGSGKTTLVKLLMKFYEYKSGEIFIDGINLKDYDISSYRKLIGYVPQDVLLFSGSIKENICFGEMYFSDDKIRDAARLACADNFIAKLPKGYDTVVGEKGATLSGGERARIALARILIRNPSVIILDEATANLDSVTELSIMKTIRNLENNPTTIIVAHRLSTITDCDTIYVFDRGKIVESGTHAQLLALNGEYTKLWKAQHGK